MNYRIILIKSITVVLTLTCGSSLAQNLSYVQQDAVKVSGVNNDAQLGALSVYGVQTTRTYVDGLGRPIQSVAMNASPNSNRDIIQINAYNSLGQQNINYLPYVDNTANPTGSFRVNAITAQSNYYYNSSPATNQVATEQTAPYNQQLFENSPLQRILATGSVGNNFQPIAGQHFRTVNYRSNISSDNILLITSAGALNGNYQANTLSVTDGVNEDLSETLLFTDGNGQVVLKRQLANQTVNDINIQFFDTYYVYNSIGQLLYIVPPKATQLLLMNPSYTLNTAVVNSLVFAYGYDNMGRIITKQVPGSGTLSIVYDPLNRPVLMQDPNLAQANTWNYIKYDAKGRPISQGLYVDNTNIGLAQMQPYVNSLAVYNTYWYESRSTAAGTKYYTNNVFPTTGITPLSYSYFDNYNWKNGPSPDFTYSSQGMTGTTHEGTAIAEETATPAAVRGMTTMLLQTTQGPGISGGEWFMKVLFYDRNGRLIQTQSNNQLNYTYGVLTDFNTNVTDFTGKTLENKVVKVTGGTAGTNTVTSVYTYDSHNARLLYVDQIYNTQAALRIAAYNYNELGQLISKQLSSGNFSNYLQTINYRYNIRGQLTSINNSTLTPDGVTSTDPDALFGMQILYDQTDANLGPVTPSYSGRISAVKWMTRNSTNALCNERSYVYSYDILGRYTGEVYAERLPNSSPTTAFSLNKDTYDENGITYDENGNIQTLKRTSIVGGVANTQIDNLTYKYDTTDPDHLLNVADGGTTSNYTGYGFTNIKNSTANYVYDANGNLLTDPYKGLSINYNKINRVNRISTTLASLNGAYVRYTYTAGGLLLRREDYPSSTSTTPTLTDYVDGFVYITAGGATTLSYLPMPEGRVINTGNSTTVTLNPEYIIRDLQGNARFSFQDNGSGAITIEQENSYYAFGEVLANSPVNTPTNVNRKLYNGGSEWQNTFGNLPDYFQTFYRNYDAAIGRWIAVDPAPESAESMGTYQYAGDNPVMDNDPLGNMTSDELASSIAMLLNSQYGGSIDADGSVNTYFSAEQEAEEGSFAYTRSISAWAGGNGIIGFNGQGPVYGNGTNKSVWFNNDNSIDVLAHSKLLGYWETLASSPDDESGGDQSMDPAKVSNTPAVVGYVQITEQQANALLGRYAASMTANQGWDDKTDFGSPSSLMGYAGLEAAKFEGLLNYTSKSATLVEDAVAASKAATVFKSAGKIFGVAGAAFTAISDATSSHGWTWGTTAKVGIGLITTFTPFGWVYGVADLGWGLITGTTITDNIGNAIDRATH